MNSLSERLRRVSITSIFVWVIGGAVAIWAVLRSIQTLSSGKHDADTYLGLIIFALATGAVYALIALGYTLVYGILFMINFAHGEIFMVGAYMGYFALVAMTPPASTLMIDFTPLGMVILFLVAMASSIIVSVLLERIAYRPLRNAPRLVPLITAIGASIFLQEAVKGLFGSRIRAYPDVHLYLLPQIFGHLEDGKGLDIVSGTYPVEMQITPLGILLVQAVGIVFIILMSVWRERRLTRTVIAEGMEPPNEKWLEMFRRYGVRFGTMRRLVMERSFWGFLRRHALAITLVIMLFALSFIPNSALRMLVQGPQPYPDEIAEMIEDGEAETAADVRAIYAERDRNAPIVVGVQFKPLAIVIFITAVIMMLGLFFIVQRTRMGRAMRAVAEDKATAALMGVDVDRVIVFTFALGAALAGAAGVLYVFYNRKLDHLIGFAPGIKAFTAAVLGGIGNVPGAMFGGFFLGGVESIAPTLLDIPRQLKDVLGFGMLALILIFRPTGLLGEVLSEKKA